MHYILYIMTKYTKGKWITLKLDKNLTIVGEQFRLARLRRNLTMELVAQRAQCSRLTVARIERGEPSVSIGVILRVLNVLQLEDDILRLAKDDKLGRMVQNLGLKERKRATKNQ